jgi:hypothetical protein
MNSPRAADTIDLLDTGGRAAVMTDLIIHHSKCGNFPILSS